MDTTRPIRKVFKSQPTLEGAGVHLRRGFGFREAPTFDPFLLFDDFRQDDPDRYLPGFPWHPHRGIETITYMLRGTAEHGDSLGNAGVIGPGDVQWMTAGSGIIHQEMPKGDADGRMGGFQLWANLPASRKMTDPRYRDVQKADIPVVGLKGGVEVRIICGTVGKARGPVRDIVTDPEYLDVFVPPDTEFIHPTRTGHTAFAYVIEGRARFSDVGKDPAYEYEPAGYFELEKTPDPDNGSVVLFGDGGRIRVATGDSPVRFLFVSGRPLAEPVAWRGPIVMNTRDELNTAFREFREGTFVKLGKTV